MSETESDRMDVDDEYGDLYNKGAINRPLKSIQVSTFKLS